MDDGVRYTKTKEGVNIAYRVLGEGARDLVFVQPWFSNLDVLDELPVIETALDRLGSICRLVIYDRRGSGLSDRLCGHATLEEGTDDLQAVLDAAESEKATLFGLNESGTLCMLAGATQPARVAGLILYGTFATTVRQDDYPWAPTLEQRALEVQFLIETWGSDDLAGAINPSAAADERFRKWGARWMRGSVSRDALPRAYDILSRTDVRHVLPAIRVPTLVLHRTNDPVVTVENGRYLAQKIPNARYVELPGDDHIPFLGEWEMILDEIEEFLTGTRRAREPERILATILFADIVDSSATANRLGDQRWHRVLNRYEELARGEVARSHGKIVKTMGDGFLATFDGPARAINCACRLRDRVQELELDTRFGIHTGEVERQGDDVVGIAVHIGARVAGVAEGGEVLVSSAVPPLVAGSGLSFQDRGEHTLKGIEGDWRLYRVG